MRVTHIITRLIVGGAQENTIASVLGLHGLPGVQAHLISGPTSGPEGSLESLVASVPGLLTLVPTLVRQIDPWKDFRALLHLTRLLREQRPDIVHTHSGKAGVLGRLAARLARVPLVVHTIHGPSFGPFQGWLSNQLFTAAERVAGRCTDHFVTVADAMRDQYLQAGIGRPGQYTRIWSGFPLKPFITARNDLELRRRYGIARTDFVVGKVARLFQLKGHDDLFAVATELVQACPNIKFLLVGNGEWRERFEHLAQSLGLRDRFVFTGLVPPENVPPLIGIMDMVVHLSRREGFARALAQSLATVRPVVAYDSDGAREVCLDGQTGFLIQTGDLETLKRRILDLARQPELRHRMGTRGQELAREWFSVSNMVTSIHSLYRQLGVP
jgi:glycosyltransferase involved in cell wall biosynthesis